MTTSHQDHDQTHAEPDRTAQFICDARITIPTFNAEFIPERDGGPCPKPAVLRLRILHDGTGCGCNGDCRIPEPDSADRSPLEPWTQIVLLCADHAFEYRDHHADQSNPSITAEDLA